MSRLELPRLALVLLVDAPFGYAAREFHGEVVTDLESATSRLSRGESCAVEIRDDRRAWLELGRAQHVPIRVLRFGAVAPSRLLREGFRHVLEVTLDTVVVRTPMPFDRRDDHGPFDVVGDIHGCLSELRCLLHRLGYTEAGHPDSRKVIFLGDLVDRGPDVHGVVTLVTAMVKRGHALCLPGNHESKLARKLRRPPRAMDALADFIEGLPSHYVLDDGKLVVAHAGLPLTMHGRDSGAVRAFALYGDTSGETDEYGLPVRADWAARYEGAATVAYGHTPVPEAVWTNNTICIDTGCVYGGALTALRWPERELVSVKAERVWAEPVRPLQVGVGAGLMPPKK